jgi:hypothetical protein
VFVFKCPQILNWVDIRRLRLPLPRERWNIFLSQELRLSYCVGLMTGSYGNTRRFNFRKIKCSFNNSIYATEFKFSSRSTNGPKLRLEKQFFLTNISTFLVEILEYRNSKFGDSLYPNPSLIAPIAHSYMTWEAFLLGEISQKLRFPVSASNSFLD